MSSALKASFLATLQEKFGRVSKLDPLSAPDRRGAALQRGNRAAPGAWVGPLLDLQRFTLLVKEARDANGGAVVRKLIDARFESAHGWSKERTRDVDWTKCRTVNGTRVCRGVEIQFSARSDLIVVEVIHLRDALTEGEVDVGVLVVPSDRLGIFLTDRGPKMADAKRHVREAGADSLPLLVIALEHDGPGPPLAKQKKRPG